MMGWWSEEGEGNGREVGREGLGKIERENNEGNRQVKVER